MVAAIFVVVALCAAGAWYYLHRPSPVAPLPKASPQPAASVRPASTAQPSPATSPTEAQVQPLDTPSFAALPAPPVPGFLKSVTTASDLRVSFFYEGDERKADDDIFYLEQTTIPNKQGEKYLLMPSSIDPVAYRFGPTAFSIFRNQESHSYQGIPFSILNPQITYSLEYVALKINDPRLISNLSVEMGIDYMADSDGDASDSPPPSTTGFLHSWFSPTTVYACGPGIYLRLVGNSRLLPVEQAGDVSWYKLEKPISLRKLSLNYCDEPKSKLRRKAKRQAQSDEEDDFDMSAYCAKVKDLTSGNLRLHVLYQPGGVTGVLQIQAVNFILSDSRANYYQPAIGQNFAHYYKAYLIDRNCMKSEQPAKCAGG
jgi:hypothetical protein